MNYSVYRTSTGEILWSGACMDEDYEALHIPAGAEKAPIGSSAPTQYFCKTAGCAVDFEEPPTRFHVWDWSEQVWKPDVAGAIAELKREVDTLYAEKSQRPVVYEGHAFDAGDASRAAILSWAVCVSGGGQLPPGFVWRDAQNFNHPADAQFVTGLSNLLALHTTAARTVAWSHKLAISQLTNLQALLDYQIGTGWG